MKYEYHNNKVTNEFCASVFVFGSNLAGIHGAGAAAWAVENRDAKYGVGLGLTDEMQKMTTRREQRDALRIVNLVNEDKRRNP